MRGEVGAERIRSRGRWEVDDAHRPVRGLDVVSLRKLAKSLSTPKYTAKGSCRRERPPRRSERQQDRGCRLLGGGLCGKPTFEDAPEPGGPDVVVLKILAEDNFGRSGSGHIMLRARRNGKENVPGSHATSAALSPGVEVQRVALVRERHPFHCDRGHVRSSLGPC